MFQECRHIKASGTKCEAPHLKGEAVAHISIFEMWVSANLPKFLSSPPISPETPPKSSLQTR